MYFLVIALDGEEEDVPNRRREAKRKHEALSTEAIERGERLLGVEILDRAHQVRGSVLVMDLPSLEAVDAWIAKEPYITHKVWSKVEVYPCQIVSGSALRSRTRKGRKC